MENSWLWIAALPLVALYCVMQAIRNIRAKRYAWATAAALSAAVVLTIPIPTHAVKVNLPAASSQ